MLDQLLGSDPSRLLKLRSSCCSFCRSAKCSSARNVCVCSVPVGLLSKGISLLSQGISLVKRKLLAHQRKHSVKDMPST